MEYHPTQVKRTRPKEAYQPESRYWRSFKHPVFVKEYAPVTSVHFSPAAPHKYAVTVGTQVQLYAPRTNRVTKTISRFKDTARSAVIRGDGKLLAAGDDTGLVQIFDLSSRAILRTLSGHRQPTHSLCFSALEPTHLLSTSDDATAKFWDIPSETPLVSFEGHTDYVRTGQISPTNPNVVVTGSYDRSVRLFDARSGGCEMILGEGDHFQAVEQVKLSPSSTLLFSASGPILRVWDLVAGGRCLRAASNHQKTITSISFATNGTRFLTGSLDRLVKVYDCSTYRVLHTMRYPAPILSIAVSPDDNNIAAGMSDGTLSIRTRIKGSKAQNAASSLLDAPENKSLSLFGSIPALEGRRLVTSRKSTKSAAESELRVESTRQRRLKPYDKFLKTFKYSAALDSVLVKTVSPATTFAVISELKNLDALRPALAGRDDVLLEPILSMLLKHATDPRYSPIACYMATLVLEMYADVIGQSPLIDNLLLRLRRKITAELRFQEVVAKTLGALDMVFCESNTRKVTQ